MVHIDYETWDQYIQEDVMKVYETTSKVVNLYQQVERIVKLTYDKLDDNLKRILLGGVTRNEDGSFDYTKNSSAKFYADFIGLTMDYSTYLQSLQLGTSIVARLISKKPMEMRLSKSIKDYIREINDLSKRIIISSGFRPREVERVSLSDLNGVFNTFKELLESLARFSSVYNPRTFFITSLTGDILKAFLEAYDKLNDKSIRNSVFRKFGVVPLRMFLNDERYTIYGYTDNSLGRYITDLDKQAYDFLRNFRSEFIRLDGNIEKDFESLLSYYITSSNLSEVLDFAFWTNPVRCHIPLSNPSKITCDNSYSEAYKAKYRSRTYTLIEMLEEFSIPLLLYYDLKFTTAQDAIIMELDPKREIHEV